MVVVFWGLFDCIIKGCSDIWKERTNCLQLQGKLLMSRRTKFTPPENGAPTLFSKRRNLPFLHSVRTQNATITREKCTKFSTGNRKKPLARIRLRGIILKRIFREKGGKTWTVFIWFGVRMSGGSCEAVMNHVFYKARNISYLNNQLLMSEERLCSI